jgi:hypothetical protein
MNKKDRIAVVVSIPWLLFALIAPAGKIEESAIVAAPILIYWAYRFVKNDISFLRVKDDKK